MPPETHRQDPRAYSRTGGFRIPAGALSALVAGLVWFTYVASGLEARDLLPHLHRMPDREDRERILALRGLQVRDPVADADASIAREDYMLMALGGYTSWIPAPTPIVVWVNGEGLPPGHGCAQRMTPGTASDAITWVPDHLAGVDAEYAVAYNARMLGRVPVDQICREGEPHATRIRDSEAQLAAMMAADPVADANRRLSAEDYRVIAVDDSGGGIVPGIDNASGWEPQRQCARFWVGQVRQVDERWAPEPRRWAEAENRLASYILNTYGPAFNRRMLEGAGLHAVCLTAEQYQISRSQRALRGEW